MKDQSSFYIHQRNNLLGRLFLSFCCLVIFSFAGLSFFVGNQFDWGVGCSLLGLGILFFAYDQQIFYFEPKQLRISRTILGVRLSQKIYPWSELYRVSMENYGRYVRIVAKLGTEKKESIILASGFKGKLSAKRLRDELRKRGNRPSSFH